MKIDIKSLLIGTLIVLIIIQSSSLVLSKVIGIPQLKLGDVILLIILASGLTVLIGASFKFGELKREDFLYLFILIGLMVIIYLYLPKYFPNIFSAVGGRGIFSTLNP